jgi:hypothetical protein
MIKMKCCVYGPTGLPWSGTPEAMALQANIRFGWISLPGTDALAYLVYLSRRNKVF